MKSTKDRITNIAALVIVIATAVKEGVAAASGDVVNWLNIAIAVVVAVIGWYTGKPTK